jgi:hypothetical protein
MFAERISASIGWHFEGAGAHAYRFTSPFTLGDDGQHAAFYVAQTTDTTYVITDLGETAMHAGSMGIHITKDRRELLNHSHGVTHARFDRKNQIVSEGLIEDAAFALIDATKLALALTFQMPKWLPKFNDLRFGIMVEEMLYASFREKLLRKPTVIGFSGRQIEFPFAIQMGNKLRYVSTISATNSSLDWTTVYQNLGKCTDAKLADDFNERAIIIQNGITPVEFGRASSLLVQCANVQSFAMAESWAEAARTADV